MKFTTSKANDRLMSEEASVDPRFRSAYHFDVPTGWMNDPNGLVMWNGKHHFFYQFNPYHYTPENMHWGHAVTTDLLHFKNAGVALAPEVENSEEGCFSGTSMVDPKDPSRLIVIYTRHCNIEQPDGTRQVREMQRLAFMREGGVLERAEEDCLTEKDLPESASPSDFRDPDIFYRDGSFWTIVASRDLETDMGQFLLFSSPDLKKWQYRFKIGPSPMFGKIAECPSLEKVDGKDVLIYSAVGVPTLGTRFRNCNSSLYAVGELDLKAGVFRIENFDEIDAGPHFYAPQAYTDEKGRVIMAAWMDMWDKAHFTGEARDNWVGSLTLPRILSLKGNRLVCSVPEELEACEKPLKRQDVLPKGFDLRFTSKGSFRLTFKDVGFPEKCFVLGRDEKGFYLDDTKTLCATGLRYAHRNYFGDCEVRLLRDRTSAELFLAGGESTMTYRIYLPSEGMTLCCEGVDPSDIDIKEVL